MSPELSSSSGVIRRVWCPYPPSRAEGAAWSSGYHLSIFTDWSVDPQPHQNSLLWLPTFHMSSKMGTQKYEVLPPTDLLLGLDGTIHT